MRDKLPVRARGDLGDACLDTSLGCTSSSLTGLDLSKVPSLMGSDLNHRFLCLCGHEVRT